MIVNTWPFLSRVSLARNLIDGLGNKMLQYNITMLSTVVHTEKEKQMNRTTLSGAAMLLALVATGAQAQTALEPHVHGEARLDVVLEGQALTLTLHSPAFNLLGFEHPAHTEQEKAALQALESAMRVPAHWIELPAAADCALSRVEIGQRHELTLEGHEQHEENEHEEDAHQVHDEHMDLNFDYRFLCAAPENLDRAQLTLFSRYPALESLEAQVITQTQSVQELNANNPYLQFK